MKMALITSLHMLLRLRTSLERAAHQIYQDSAMRKIYFITGALLTCAPAGAEHQCGQDQSAVIEAEARCVPQGGISIGVGNEEGATVACLASKEVQGRCGPDGQITRLHAYMAWFNKLKKFESSCT